MNTSLLHYLAGTAGSHDPAFGDSESPGPFPGEPETASVILCESQPVTAEGVRTLLATSADLRVVSLCDSLTALRDAARRSYERTGANAILLVDKAMGVEAILQLLRDLATAPQPVRVVVWGLAITEAEALRLLQAGAQGILRKTSDPALLMTCLRAVAAGQNWMEDSIFRQNFRLERYPRSELTPREQQVLELVERGLKNREIGRDLGIRPGTVKIHLKHIFEKTGVRGRYGLALTGLKEKGLLGAPQHAFGATAYSGGKR